MAGPSSLSTNDFLIALRLQLEENGAGTVEITSLLDLPQLASPDPALQRDAALAYSLVESELSVVRDAAFAHRIAAEECGFMTKKPTNESDNDISVVEDSDRDELNLCNGERNQQTNSTEDGDILLSGLAIPPVQCPICTDFFPPAACFASVSCRDVFCSPCIRKYLTVLANETHQFPIRCPSCRDFLDHQQCLIAMVGTGDTYVALQQLILNRQHFAHIRYCSNKICGEPFDWYDNPMLGKLSNSYCVTCPFCKEDTCTQCKDRWHQGETCEQHVDKKDWNSVMQLVKQKSWKRCPRCGFVIERRKGDCNFVKCRCGCGFCYRCGVEYVNLVATVGNSHGKQKCNCGLFDGVHT